MATQVSIASILASPTLNSKQRHVAALAFIQAEARELDAGMSLAASTALGHFVNALRRELCAMKRMRRQAA